MGWVAETEPLLVAQSWLRTRGTGLIFPLPELGWEEFLGWRVGESARDTLRMCVLEVALLSGQSHSWEEGPCLSCSLLYPYSTQHEPGPQEAPSWDGWLKT